MNEILTTISTLFQVATCVLVYMLITNQKGILDLLLSQGELIRNSSKHQMLKDHYFDLQAREMQKFIEEFLGRDFNVDCKFLKITGGATNQYALWIWKRYETRDMGCMINATSIPEMIKDFMHVYYSTPYFTDATAFPKG